MNGRPDAEARRARRAARQIIAHHLGDGAHRVRAREAGVPVPRVLEVGNQPGPFVYMVSALARGEEASGHPSRMQLLGQLGELAARIHGVATHGFGSTFDWSQNQLSRCDTWDAYLQRELALEARLETLAAHGGVEPERLRRLRVRLGEIGELAGAPRLNHGDLRLKNVLATPDGRITALLDWEFATSNAVPFWDTSLALHDLSIDEKHASLRRARSLFAVSPVGRGQAARP